MKNYILLEIIGKGARKPLMFTDLEEAKKKLKKRLLQRIRYQRKSIRRFS